MEESLEKDETHCCPWSPNILVVGNQGEQMDILLVEDNAGDELLVRDIVNKGAVPVTLRVARDGEQALAILGDRDFQPGLIILDLNLPRISGLALLERWKPSRTPVVVFSSSSSDAERKRVLELGAREFVQKPADLDAYTNAVRGMIQRWGADGKETACGA
jgi:DNA-binding response OmpR family regulator